MNLLQRFGFLRLAFFLAVGVMSPGQTLGARQSQPCQAFEPVREHRLGPGRPLFGHVQGLEVNDKFFFLTAVTTTRETGFLYIYARAGGEGRPPVWQYDLWGLAREHAGDCGRLNTETLNHPSGLHLEGGQLYVAIAPSADRGPSCVMALDVHDPSAPVVQWASRVDDHIGAVLHLPDAVIGFNWGSDDYWRLEGRDYTRRLPAREELQGELAEELHIQDCDRVEGFLYCGHSRHEEDNLLKVYRATAFGTEPSTLKPWVVTLPALGSQHGGTHEGLAVQDERLFLLPDDGDESGVSLYELRCRASGVE
jgi:hypothetical protein